MKNFKFFEGTMLLLFMILGGMLTVHLLHKSQPEFDKETSVKINAHLNTLRMINARLDSMADALDVEEITKHEYDQIQVFVKKYPMLKIFVTDAMLDSVITKKERRTIYRKYEVLYAHDREARREADWKHIRRVKAELDARIFRDSLLQTKKSKQ